MMNRTFTVLNGHAVHALLIIALLLLPWVADAAAPSVPAETQTAPKRIAALDVQSKSDIEEQELIYISDLMRGAVRRALPGNRFLLMTRENIADLMPGGGTLNDCVGDCAVTVGRKLGAEFVISSELFVLQSGRKLSLSLYNTTDANLVASTAVSGADLAELEGKIKQSVAELLGALSQDVDAGTQRRISAQREDWQPNMADMVLLEVVTTPPGATILLDGSPFCESTPCRGEVVVGSHSMEAILGDYYPVSRDLDLVKSTNRSEVIELKPRFALFDFSTSAPSIALRLDGKPIGESPVLGLRVFPGAHYVSIADERYKEGGVQFSASEGGSESIRIDVEPRIGAIQFLARDSLDQPVAARVTVDGKYIGDTPVIKSLMVGRHEVALNTEDESWSGAVVISERQEQRETVKLVPRSPGTNPAGKAKRVSHPHNSKPGRWGLSVFGGPDSQWDVPSAVYFGAPASWSIGFERLGKGARFGLTGVGYFNRSELSGAKAMPHLGMKGVGVTARIPLTKARSGGYGLVGVQVLTGSITTGGWQRYDDGFGVQRLIFLHQELDGPGYLLQLGGGLDVTLGDGSDRGYFSCFVEYARTAPWFSFAHVDLDNGTRFDEGFSLNGFASGFNQIRLGLRWNWR